LWIERNGFTLGQEGGCTLQKGDAAFMHSAAWEQVLRQLIGAMKNERALEEENARLRGDLLTIASRVSHDLRTPLGGIVTAAEMLHEFHSEQQQAGTMTKAISDSVDDLTHLIGQISFITRATANPIQPGPVNMAEVVSRTLQRLEHRILKKGAIVVEPPSWPEVRGVAPWLDVIWSNYLTNALEHTTEKPRIELTWREENGSCRFGIFDNGGGVREDLRPLLFQPFDTLHKPGGARGLGLSIVQRLLQLQGGHCGYEPLTGGSFFFFSLPGKQEDGMEES
jgi:signal transduction histidine kinase